MPEASCVTRRLSGAKAAAVQYVCGDAQKNTPTRRPKPRQPGYHPSSPQPPVEQPPCVTFFSPPTPQEMPATASVCTKTNRCSGASETDCVSCAHRHQILLQHATECAHTHRSSVSTTNQLHAKGAQMGSRGEESRRGIDGIVSVAFASRANSCLSGLPWFGYLMQGGAGVGGGGVECGEHARTRRRTRFHLLPVCLSTNSSSLPTQAQWRTVMRPSTRFFAAGPACSGSVPIEGFKNVDSRVNDC